MSRELARTIAKLAGASTSRAAYLKACFAAIVRAFNSPYGSASVRFGAEVIEDYWHTGGTDPRFWQKPVEEILNESLQDARPIARQFSSRDARFRIAMISVILRDLSGSMVGVFSLVLRVDDDAQAVLQRELVESHAAQVMLGCARIEAASDQPRAQAPSQELSKSAGYRTGTELAFALASSLRNRLGCEHAVIGWARGARVRVVSVSGLDEVSERASSIRLIRDAMGESVDRGEPIAVQTGEETGFRVHRLWHEQCGGAAVLSVPVPAGNDGTLVVSLRRAGRMGFTPEEVSGVTQLVLPYAPAFDLLDRASRSVVSHAAAATRRECRTLLAPGGWGRKAGVAASLAAALWIAFGTLPYSVSAATTVRPAELRHVAAPFEGRLAAVLVSPGDAVTEGQAVAEFDVSGLRVEREQVAAEVAIAQIDEDRALAAVSPAEAALARAERRRAEARLAEIDRRIALATVRAPIAGRVLSGDPRRRIGESLPVGEPLFEIADESEWTVEIEMPQHVAEDLTLGKNGYFATSARPETSSAIVLSRIRPQPEVRGGKTVYLAEAALHNPEPWIKPGMEGTSRVVLARRPVWWIASHRVIEHIRTNFWL